MTGMTDQISAENLAIIKKLADERDFLANQKGTDIYERLGCLTPDEAEDERLRRINRLPHLLNQFHTSTPRHPPVCVDGAEDDYQRYCIRAKGHKGTHI